MDYNPNSIWSSKEKKYEYQAPDTKPISPSKPGGAAGAPIKTGGSDTKKIIIASALGVVVLAFLGFMYYLLKPAPPQNVALTFSDPGQVMVGEPFTLTVLYVNNSQNVLQNTALSLTLPLGVSIVGQPADRGQRVAQVATGNLQPGEKASSTFNLILTGSPQSVAHVDAQFAYGVSGSPSAQYGVQATANVLVGQPAVAVAVNAPSSVFSGQTFDATVAYINNTGHALNNVQIKLQYPQGYLLQKASGTQPTSLAADASGTFTVTGSLVGQDSALFSIGASVVVMVDGQPYTIASPSANLAIAASPLSLGIALNGSPNGSGDYIARQGDTLNYILTYLNNSSTTFQNVQITATLAGAMYNFASVRSDATFNSLTNTLTWYPANSPELASVAPGQSGSVTFSVNTRAAFPIRFFGDKNYTLKVQARIQSATVPPGTTAAATVSLASLQNKVGGAIALAAAGYYHEPKALGISNTGPYPPKVDKATTYTIHWRITDYATDAQNVTVAATLQSGTTCVSSTSSLSIPSSTLTCNPATGQVTWQVPLVPATTGVVNAPAEAVFQVVNTPAINQLGATIPLISGAALQATDAFTGAALAAQAPAISTDLPDDTSGPSDRKVTQ